MAITESVLFNGTQFRTFEITATLDADTTHVFPHGLPSIPNSVVLVPHNSQASAIAQWRLNNVTATDIAIEKTNVAASGSAAVQLVVEAQVKHSMIQ